MAENSGQALEGFSSLLRLVRHMSTSRSMARWRSRLRDDAAQSRHQKRHQWLFGMWFKGRQDG